MAEILDTVRRRQTLMSRLSLASAAGVALSVLSSGVAYGFDAGLLTFGAVALIPLMPVLGLPLSSEKTKNQEC